MSTPLARFRQHRADAIMTGMVFVWGFHFIVMKDAVADISPLTFNALRFLIGLPVLLVFAHYQRTWRELPRRDIALIGVLSFTGPLFYQIGFVLGIERTTATNAALLAATLPTWTAFFSILMGLVEIRRRLLLGIGVTLVGVVLVILSRSESGLSLSRDDLIGSALVLGATLVSAFSNVINKPVIDRLGGIRVAIWKYLFVVTGLLILAGPEIAQLSGDDLPLSSTPNILYSGVISGVGGFLAMNFALQEIGPTRAATYFNFNPIVAAFAGIAILGEPVSIGLLTGGVLTLWGVATVRRNTYLRKRPTAESP